MAFSLLRIVVPLFTLASACGPTTAGETDAGPASETGTTADPGGTETGAIAETGAAESGAAESGTAESGTAGGTETGEPGGQCDVSDPGLLFVQPYTGGLGPMHASCVLLASAPEMDAALRVELDCGGESVAFRIKNGPVPDLASRIGATVELDSDYQWNDGGSFEPSWIVLREAGTLLYAGVYGHSLAPAGSDAGVYVPLTIEPVFGICAIVPLSESGQGGDSYFCEQGARIQLGFSVGDAPQVLLAAGESTAITTDVGSYQIDVRTAVRGIACQVDNPVVDEDTYAFAIAWAPN